MKRIVILFNLLFGLLYQSKSQNLVANYSFEESTNEENPYPDTKNDIDDLSNWDDDNCIYVYDEDFGTTIETNNHSPDWLSTSSSGYFVNVNGISCKARTGSNYIGMAHDEYIGQEISLIQGKKYQVSLHVKKTDKYLGGFKTSIWENDITSTVNIYLSKKQLEYYYSCKDYLKNHLCEVGQSEGDKKKDGSGQEIILVASLNIDNSEFNTITGNNLYPEWYYLNEEFVLPSNDFKWISIEKVNCNGRILIDDVKIVDMCNKCNDNILIENRKYEMYSFIEETNLPIIVGENVGDVSNDFLVEVGNTSNVNYSSGSSVNLLPGFSVENGAVFTAIIDNCNTKNSPINNGNLQADFVFTPGLYPAGLYNVGNADTYVIRVYNRLSDLIGEYTGVVVNDTIIFGEDLGWHPTDELTVVVYLYNCSDELVFSYHLLLVAGKTEEKNEGTTLFNLPLKNINYEVKSDLLVYDLNGSIIYKCNTCSPREITQELNNSTFSSGMYIIREAGNSSLTYKLIKP